MKNYKEYLDYCQRLAEDINDSYSDDIDLNDRIHEIADGCQYVIYYSKAWDLVNMMQWANRELLEEATNESGRWCTYENENDINAYMSELAYYLIRNGVYSAYQHIESEAVA